MRMIFVFSSLVGCSIASRTSLGSSLLTTFPPLISNWLVIDTFPTQTYLSMNWSQNCCLEHCSASPAIFLKTAFSSSSEKMGWPSSSSSGRAATEDANFALDSASPSAPMLANTAAASLLSCFIFALKTCVIWSNQTPAEKSSSTKHAAALVVAAIFSVRPATMSEASFCRRPATKRCSWSRRRALCWSSSACSAAHFSAAPPASSAPPVAANAAPLPSNRLRSSSTALSACCWDVPAFSQAAFIASGAASAGSIKAWVASLAASTCFSTSPSLTCTSRRTRSRFFSDNPLLTSASFFVEASTLACSAASASPVCAWATSDSLLAARRFIEMNVFVPPTPRCASCDTPSSAARALPASSRGSSSPASSGASASMTLPTRPSASLTRCSHSETMDLTMTCSRRSWIFRPASSSFAWASLTCGSSLAISSCGRALVRPCPSSHLPNAFRAVCPSLSAVSAAFTKSTPDPLGFSASSPPSGFSDPSPPSSGFSAFSASSASRASAACTAESTLARASCSVWRASAATFLAARRCSTLWASFLAVTTSFCAALNLVWSLMKRSRISSECSLPFASICLWVMNRLASASAGFAASSAFLASSVCALTSSGVISASLSMSSRAAAASFILPASSSAPFTWLSASRDSAACLRLAMAVLTLVSLSVCSCSCLWSSCSFSVASLAAPAAKRLASTSFVAMNMRAMDTAVLAEVAAASQAFTAASVSSVGNSSTPIKNGASASAAFETASVTVASLSVASLMRPSQALRSASSFWASRRTARRSSPFFNLSSSLAISASVIGPAATFFFNTIRRAMAKWSFAFRSACWASARVSLDEFSSSTLFASSAASTSSSAGDSASMISVTACFACCRCRKSCLAVFNGLSLFCAVVSCIFIRANSFNDSSRTCTCCSLCRSDCFEFR
mmetsp:Transcript_37434/g.105091  ORF Transcript_37434/g.105091 Transcript_37434/m.105091 type:complete len:913 (-) Transcript_37434:1345-4083(-)